MKHLPKLQQIKLSDYRAAKVESLPCFFLYLGLSATRCTACLAPGSGVVALAKICNDDSRYERPGDGEIISTGSLEFGDVQGSRYISISACNANPW